MDVKALNGYAPLHIAVKKEDMEMVKTLLKLKASITARMCFVIGKLTPFLDSGPDRGQSPVE